MVVGEHGTKQAYHSRSLDIVSQPSSRRFFAEMTGKINLHRTVRLGGTADRPENLRSTEVSTDRRIKTNAAPLLSGRPIQHRFAQETCYAPAVFALDQFRDPHSLEDNRIRGENFSTRMTPRIVTNARNAPFATIGSLLVSIVLFSEASYLFLISANSLSQGKIPNP